MGIGTRNSSPGGRKNFYRLHRNDDALGDLSSHNKVEALHNNEVTLQDHREKFRKIISARAEMQTSRKNRSWRLKDNVNSAKWFATKERTAFAVHRWKALAMMN